MRTTSQSLLLALAILVTGQVLLPTNSSGVPSPTPQITAGTIANGWRTTAGADGHPPTDGPPSQSPNPAAARTFDCGAPLPTGERTADGLDPCAQPQDTCKGQATTDATGQPTTTTATQTQNADGTWSTVNLNCIAAPPARQDPVAAAAKDAFTKLVPHVTISAAAQNGVSIVNIETLYWLGTPATVDLGTTPLLGQPVRLLATVQTVQWNFGDGHSATSQGPGRPFTAADYCNTRTCPAWFGHTYTEPTRNLTVSATATWTGRYSINGGPFIAITGTVASPATTIGMEVEQSLSVLVPNPGETD